MATTTRIDNSQDTLDTRDIIARYEELEPSEDEEGEDSKDQDDKDELAVLKQLLDDLEGNGGDEQWRGSWYPLTLIRSTYFYDYAQELAEDIGAIDKDVQWPLMHIDWEAAAEDLQEDYSAIDYDGIEYYYR